MMNGQQWLRQFAIAAVALSSGACASVGSPWQPTDTRTPAEVRSDSIAYETARVRAAVPTSPLAVEPATGPGQDVWREGTTAPGLRILVGTESRGLWLMRDTTVLFHAPVAVGMEEGFTYDGTTYEFATPISRRTVEAKDTMPTWVPPDWHYFEIALEKDLDVVHLRPGQKVELGDSTFIEVRGADVGRINRFDNFWPFTPGTEIVFDGRVFVPPFGTRQRQIPDVLGTHKLVMGDGYLIHGTNQDTSIGDAVSHGCVRMFNEDVATLYRLVPVGTPVYIF